MQGVFINYRRDDASGYARLLFERLAREFGRDQIFMDVEAIREPGTDFVEAIHSNVGRCTVLLALIGKSWASSTDHQGNRRLDHAEDFVRLEIASALKRNVRVIPVLVQGAHMPEPKDLPEELVALTRRQALKLSHEDWEYDVGKLIEALSKIPELASRRHSAHPAQEVQPTVHKGLSGRALILTAIGGVVGSIALLAWIGSAIEDSPLPERRALPVPAPETEPRGEVSPVLARPERPVRAVASPEVRQAQAQLSALGYDPGPIDGMMGTATVSAIREFQEDEGYPVSGRVDEELLLQLAEATLDEIPQEDYVPVAPYVNLSGTWYDNNGTPILIEQVGNSLRVGGFNPVVNQFSQIGAGSLEGDMLTVHYTNDLGVSGMVVATVSADGRHLNGTDTNTVTGMAVTNTWHREHLPWQ